MTVNKVVPERITIDDLGGVKTDAFPVEDPDTDLDSLDHNEMIANIAALSMTAPRAIVTLQEDSGNLLVMAYTSLWGNTTEPTVTWNETGSWTLTFPTSVADALQDSGDSRYSSMTNHSIAFFAVQASIYGGSTYKPVTAGVTAANEVTILCWDTTTFSGYADPPTGAIITVVVY